jgi:dienelactone hydrolase
MKSKYLVSLHVMMITMVAINSFAQSGSKTFTIKEEIVNYHSSDGLTLTGFIAYNGSSDEKLPVVLVVPEWWGVNDYTRMRARKLAELGYFAMVADMYGNGKTAVDPKEAQSLTMPFYQDPHLAKSRLDDAINKIHEYPQADQGDMAAIGYCFGGFVVLNAAKLGAGLKGVVSFHGSLGGVSPDKKLLTAKILICHGGSDKFVSQQDVGAFKHKMDSIGATYSFKTYADATHAFTNPDATKIGKEFSMPIEYNAKADQDSWNDMKVFLAALFKK